MGRTSAGRRRIRESSGDRLFLGIVYIVLSVVLVIVLYPLIYVVSASISDPLAVSSGRVWLWPVGITLRGYQVAFENPEIVTGYLNSLFYTVFGALISVTLTVSLAYPLSRSTLFGKDVLIAFVVFTLGRIREGSGPAGPLAIPGNPAEGLRRLSQESPDGFGIVQSWGLSRGSGMRVPPPGWPTPILLPAPAGGAQRVGGIGD